MFSKYLYCAKSKQRRKGEQTAAWRFSLLHFSININMRDFPASWQVYSGQFLSRRFSFALQN